MDNSWLLNRNCGVHMTIRDVDCEGFDAMKMAEDFNTMGVNFISFFAGGYITTYPSSIPESRKSPYLGDRDLVREILDALHQYDIKAAAMADFSVLPEELLKKHPDWVKRDKNGHPYEYDAGTGVYTACLLGGYIDEYGIRMIREIVETYDVDAMKFGGGSYGFDGRICYCDKCRDSFQIYSEFDLPDHPDWSHPVWKKYHEWKTEQITKTVIKLNQAVKSICPDMPVMGNSFTFGALDMEQIAANQDMVQLESQGRVTFGPDLTGTIHPITYTAEAASYMTNVTDTPVWLVVSYFTHAPWRRTAFTRAEQRVYMAQIAAFGGSPMVNLSGGPPLVHEDQRGFKAPSEIWRFIRDHREYYNQDRSAADIAIIYSDRSVAYYGGDDPQNKYIAGFRGMERALWEHHIPFDIISQNLLMDGRFAKYQTLILENYACMRIEEAQAIRNFIANGGSVIANFETSLYDESGNLLTDFCLGDVLGISYAGYTGNVFGENPKNMQNYCKIVQRTPLLEGLDDTNLLPAAGNYCRVTAAADTQTSLILGKSFMVLPEGLSYQTGDDIGDPMVISREHESGGRTVYFAGQFDKLNHLTGLEEISTLLANTVCWARKTPLQYFCHAPDSIMCSVRLQQGRINFHLVNLSGGQRFIKETIPVFNIELEVDKKACPTINKVLSLKTGDHLTYTEKKSSYTITLPKLDAYDMISIQI